MFYGAFSYGHSQIESVYQYILNQEKHHRKKTYREEYLEFLEKFEVPYEEKITLQVLRERLEKRQASARLKPVLLQGDKAVNYGRVIEVMDVLKELAIENLGLVLKPRQR